MGWISTFRVVVVVRNDELVTVVVFMPILVAHCIELNSHRERRQALCGVTNFVRRRVVAPCCKKKGRSVAARPYFCGFVPSHSGSKQGCNTEELGEEPAADDEEQTDDALGLELRRFSASYFHLNYCST